ncbi:NAD kinase 2, mitochondrial-like isoform X1 [Homarus americanus]|uniref:NAD kinase 2, mitochondrial-like isoform X1 n=2 Tax=Homarus americanus TaxID=6706 RepID=UPI001C47FE6B|nr:NAD kinase 2, mitochondrial-like isoform X1 [Homarus americanus]
MNNLRSIFSYRNTSILKTGVTMCGCRRSYAVMSPQHLEPGNFKPKRVLILTKLSRYEFEKRRHPELTERQLEKCLTARGSDYNILLYHHYIHKGVENTVNSVFTAAGIETKTVYRFDYTESNIQWADAVVTTGGDGTYLLAASKILDRNKPLIGFNSDPTRSKGQLCLPQKYSVEVKEAVEKLLKGKFRWTFRSRIRVTLIGDDIFKPPVELHDQQLRYHEYRYLDLEPHACAIRESIPPCSETGMARRVLPFLALNEVFIGECVSARVSYMELSFDDVKGIKQKCSGLIASTGTGSTSWTYNVNKLTEQNMEEILTIVKEETGFKIQDTDQLFVRKITEKFNQMLITDPEVPKMVYTIRDQLVTSPMRNECVKPRGFAKSIGVKSRCFDASLVIDGGLSFTFNDGTRALLEIYDQDALRTVTLHGDSMEVAFKH